MTTFREFRDGPAGDLACRMGLDISGCISWRHFTDMAVAYNNCEGRLVEAGRRLYGIASTGEKPVVCALLAAADFAWLAAQFKGRCGIVSGSYGRARTVTEALAAAGREVPSGVRVVAVCNNSDTAHPNDPFDHIIFDRKAMYERIVDLVCVQDFAGIRELVPPCLVRVGTAASSPTPGQP